MKNLAIRILLALISLIPLSTYAEKEIPAVRYDTITDGKNLVIRGYDKKGSICLESYMGPAYTFRGYHYYYTKSLDYLDWDRDEGYKETWISQHYKKKATRYYKKGYRTKESGAPAYLGLHYFLGLGVKKNQKKGVALLKEASENGQEEVNDLLGFCCYHGIGTNQDISQAIHYWSENGKKHNENSGAKVEYEICNIKDQSVDSTIVSQLKPKENIDSLMHYISTIDDQYNKYYHYNVVCIAPDSLGNDWVNYSVIWKITDPDTDKMPYLGYVVNDGFVTYITGKSALKYFDYSDSSDTANFIHKTDLIHRGGKETKSLDDLPLYHCGATALLYNNNCYIVDKKHWSIAMNYLDIRMYREIEGVSLFHYKSPIYNFISKYKE